MQVTLLIRTPQDEVPLRLDQTITIGRTELATVVIDDSGLSRVHITIHLRADGARLVDEGSLNGSFVNGVKVGPGGVLLTDGDDITIGNSTRIFVQVESVGSSPTAVAGVQAQARPTTAAGSAVGQPQAAPKTSAESTQPLPTFVIAAIIAAAVIVVGTVIALIVVNRSGAQGPGGNASEVRITRVRNTINQIQIPEALFDEWDVEEQQIPDVQISQEDVRAALRDVTADRGAPMGTSAAVDVPPELKHYADKRRFLAIQSAESIEQKIVTPADYPELAGLAANKQFVELKPVTDDYVLYAVGGGISGGLFSHFDTPAKLSYPLFKSDAEMQAGMADADPALKQRVMDFYKQPQFRALAARELEVVTQFAHGFGGNTFDVNDAGGRIQFKRHMLSIVRAPTLGIIERLAHAYKAKFNRRLPLSSLMRTDEYQFELSKRNANAARNAIPPHTTGCAFDVSYKYMNAAEQAFVMAEIAQLEKSGLVEALRENNNCFHVFVFPDGKPPPEALVQQTMR